ncbi:MAG: hypothetical protein V9H69_11150 [Anaerolineae bacterium]
MWLPLGQAEMRVAAPPALEKQAPSTRRPAKKGWSVSMPVSRITTVWPWPSMPLAQTAGSPMLWVLLSRAGAGRYILLDAGHLRQAGQAGQAGRIHPQSHVGDGDEGSRHLCAAALQAGQQRVAGCGDGGSLVQRLGRAGLPFGGEGLGQRQLSQHQQAAGAAGPGQQALQRGPSLVSGGAGRGVPDAVRAAAAPGR